MGSSHGTNRICLYIIYTYQVERCPVFFSFYHAPFLFFWPSNIWSHLCFLAQFSPEKFVETMKLMEHRYGAKDFVTCSDKSLLAPGTFYLTKVDSMYRRYYAQKVVDTDKCRTAVSHENGSLLNGH